MAFFFSLLPVYYIPPGNTFTLQPSSSSHLGRSSLSYGCSAAPSSSPAPALPHSPHWWLATQVTLKKNTFIYSQTPGLRFPLRALTQTATEGPGNSLPHCSPVEGNVLSLKQKSCRARESRTWKEHVPWQYQRDSALLPQETAAVQHIRILLRADNVTRAHDQSTRGQETSLGRVEEVWPRTETRINSAHFHFLYSKMNSWSESMNVMPSFPPQFLLLHPPTSSSSPSHQFEPGTTEHIFFTYYWRLADH